METLVNTSFLYLWKPHIMEFNSIQNGIFWGCSRMGGGGAGFLAPRLQNLPHISYNDKTWHSYTLYKEGINHVTRLLSSADLHILHI